ncbi:MAG: DUF6597 domain-containing transcriptional factor [Egibacteraceae bacterium]
MSEREVRSVEEDARGIITPATGLARFRLDRYPASDAAARFVDRYWLVSWDLTGQAPHTQKVLAHPVVNAVFTAGVATVTGVTTRMSVRTLEGAGWALGVMFRPAGFRPFLGGPMSSITDQVLLLSDVFGPGGRDLRREVFAAADVAGRIGLIDRFLAARAPAGRQASEATGELVERVAGDAGLVRVDALAAQAGVSPRQLQRRFADHVGASPKAIIRRYRLYEAAERARHGRRVDWAALAAELGYSDQAHLTRDFSAAIGTPPHRYARANQP